MKIKRLYTKANVSPYADQEFVTRQSEIRNPDGSVASDASVVIVPDTWSSVATDIIAQKYFRKSGVPAKTKKMTEEDIETGANVLAFCFWGMVLSNAGLLMYVHSL